MQLRQSTAKGEIQDACTASLVQTASWIVDGDKGGRKKGNGNNIMWGGRGDICQSCLVRGDQHESHADVSASDAVSSRLASGNVPAEGDALPRSQAEEEGREAGDEARGRSCGKGVELIWKSW